jgi:hypothetical protein
MPSPNRAPRDFGLVLWCLVHRIKVQIEELTPEMIEAVREHCKMSPERFALCRERHPEAWANMLARRARRRRWWSEHGRIDPGWTPPDPSRPHTKSNPAPLLIYNVDGAKRRALRRRGAPEWQMKAIVRKLDRIRNSPPKTTAGHVRALDRVLVELFRANGMLP